MAFPGLGKKKPTSHAAEDGASSAPTMIVPRGADLRVDAHGHLSIRTPGNLVIQNSGVYGAIESISGSIRVEPEAKVEAVTVRCAETCYVQGSLTAWKVTARSIQVAEEAEAKIVLQESEHLEVGKGGRLVGNFASEKELYTLFTQYASYFDDQAFPVDAEVRHALLQAGGADATADEQDEPLKAESIDEDWGDDEDSGVQEAKALLGASMLPGPLSEVLQILNQEAQREEHGSRNRKLLNELSGLIRGGELETLKHTHSTLFRRIGKQTRPLRKAGQLLEEYFR